MRDVVASIRAGLHGVQDRLGPFGPRARRKLDEAIVRAAREAAGEPRSCSSTPARATPTGRTGSNGRCARAEMLADYDVGWFEEALRPDAIDDFVELRRPAGADRRRRGADAAPGLHPWLTRGALDIVQPDVTKVGGITEQRRIAWMADEFGVKYVGHGWNTALGVAADLQLAAAMPLCDLVEFIGGSPTSTASRSSRSGSTPKAGSPSPMRRASASPSTVTSSPAYTDDPARALRVAAA
jgi:L-alanine-DL-glutamate epimerase-like enolase superfamily enzyme